MKAVIKYSTIVVALVFVAMLSACNTKSDEGTKAVPEEVIVDAVPEEVIVDAEVGKVIIDVEAFGKDLGVKEVAAQRPGGARSGGAPGGDRSGGAPGGDRSGGAPGGDRSGGAPAGERAGGTPPAGGGASTAQEWTAADIQKAVTELPKRYNDPGKTYLVTNSPDPALTLAFIQALQPLNVLYLYMEPGGDEVPMCELKKVAGIPDTDSNYGVRFEIVEEGDKVFMNFNSDEPGARAHTFATDDTCKLTIPEIAKGKHLYVHARGRYCTMVVLAFNYINDSKSVSLAYHEEDYICAASSSDDIKVGDVTPRTLANDL